MHFSKCTHTGDIDYEFSHWFGSLGFIGEHDAVLTYQETIKSMEKTKEEISVQCGES